MHHANSYSLSARPSILTGGTFLCFILAFFINASLIIFVLPLWCGNLVLYPTKRNFKFLVILLAAFALCSVHSHQLPGANYFQFNIAWSNFAHVAKELAPLISWPLFAAELATITLCIVALQRLHQRNRRDIDSGSIERRGAKAVVFLAAAVVYLLVVANLNWTRINDYSARYFILMFSFVPSLCVAMVVDACVAYRRLALKQMDKRVSYAMTASAAVIFLGTVASHVGFVDRRCPDVDAARRANIHKLSELATQHRASVITAENDIRFYWTVWPAVFETIRRRQTADEARPTVFGFTYRGEVLKAEIVEHLRQSLRVVFVCGAQEARKCYDWLVMNNIGFGYWPDHAFIVEQGSLPQGGTYLVLALERDAAGAIGASVPSPGEIELYERLLFTEGARKEQAGIVIRARGKTELGVYGPYVQMSSGRYQVRFNIDESSAVQNLDDELLKIEVINRDREIYADVVVRRRDLIIQPNGNWAAATFTLPHSLPRNNIIEFRVWTTGKSDLVIRGLNLTRDPAEPKGQQAVTKLYAIPGN